MSETVEERDRRTIAAEMAAAGFHQVSLEALLNCGDTPREWIQPIIRSMHTVETPHLLDGLVRCLTDHKARGSSEADLIALFRRLVGTPAQTMVGWAIGNAIHFLGPRPVWRDVLDIAKDPCLGLERQMFVMSLGKIKAQIELEDVLPLLRQPVVELHAVSAVKQFRDARAVPALHELSQNGSNATVRRRAAEAIVSIGKYAKPGNSRF